MALVCTVMFGVFPCNPLHIVNVGCFLFVQRM